MKNECDYFQVNCWRFVGDLLGKVRVKKKAVRIEKHTTSAIRHGVDVCTILFLNCSEGGFKAILSVGGRCRDVEIGGEKREKK